MGGIDIILKWQLFMAARVAHKKKMVVQVTLW
jgi:hypothetical protein